MEMISIADYAKGQNVTYEAVRKQVVRYSAELKDHVIRKGRKQFLDEWAVNFLTERRRENPVILVSQDKTEEIEQLTDQVEALKNELLKAQQQIIELQGASQKLIETQVRYELQEKTLSETREQLEELRKSSAEQKAEDAAVISRLMQERNAAVEEASSYQKSWFGFYRKK